MIIVKDSEKDMLDILETVYGFSKPIILDSPEQVESFMNALYLSKNKPENKEKSKIKCKSLKGDEIKEYFKNVGIDCSCDDEAEVDVVEGESGVILINKGVINVNLNSSGN